MDLIVHCARRHPKWQFVLIGAMDGCDTAEAALLANIVFLGEKPYAELPHYLNAFDVCLIPFKLMDLTRATNPVKVYEYLCAGEWAVANTDMPVQGSMPPGSRSTVTRTAAEVRQSDRHRNLRGAGPCDRQTASAYGPAAMEGTDERVS